MVSAIVVCPKCHYDWELVFIESRFGSCPNCGVKVDLYRCIAK
jgi:hypothetical protein